MVSKSACGTQNTLMFSTGMAKLYRLYDELHPMLMRMMVYTGKKAQKCWKYDNFKQVWFSLSVFEWEVAPILQNSL